MKKHILVQLVILLSLVTVSMTAHARFSTEDTRSVIDPVYDESLNSDNMVSVIDPVYLLDDRGLLNKVSAGRLYLNLSDPREVPSIIDPVYSVGMGLSVYEVIDPVYMKDDHGDWFRVIDPVYIIVDQSKTISVIDPVYHEKVGILVQ